MLPKVSRGGLVIMASFQAKHKPVTLANRHRRHPDPGVGELARGSAVDDAVLQYRRLDQLGDGDLGLGDVPSVSRKPATPVELLRSQPAGRDTHKLRCS